VWSRCKHFDVFLSRKQTIVVGLQFVCVVLELKALTPLHVNQRGGVLFPHGFGGLSLSKVFCPSSNFQVARRVMLSCTCAQPIRIQVKNRCCSQAPHKKVLFQLQCPSHCPFDTQPGNPMLTFRVDLPSPLVLLQTLADL